MDEKQKSMYAIVNISGQQFKVEKNRKLYVHRLNADVGSSVEFNEVMLVEEDGKIQVGKPHLDGVTVIANVMEHLKGDKVLIFKKKRRKGYQKMNGHRQYLTQIEVEGIYQNGISDKKATKKQSTKKEETEVVAETKVESQENTETKE